VRAVPCSGARKEDLGLFRLWNRWYLRRWVTKCLITRNWHSRRWPLCRWT